MNEVESNFGVLQPRLVLEQARNIERDIERNVVISMPSTHDAGNPTIFGLRRYRLRTTQ